MHTQPDLSTDPDLPHLITAYLQHLRALDPGCCWSDPDWWRREPSARLLRARRDGRTVGFAIVAGGAQVDADVASEICDCYCTDPWAVPDLFRRALAALWPPAGFQILRSNTRALRVVDGMLLRHGLPLRRQAARDLGMAVWKYRIPAPAKPLGPQS